MLNTNVERSGQAQVLFELAKLDTSFINLYRLD